MPGNPGFRAEVKQCITSSAGLVSANSWLFLSPDSSRWSVDISFLLLPLLGGQPSLPRGLERQLGRGSHIHHKQQWLMLSKWIWHCWGDSFTSLEQPLVFAAFLPIAAPVPSWMGFPSFTSSAAVADWLWILSSVQCKLTLLPVKDNQNLLLTSSCSVIYRIVPVGSWGSTSVEAANGRRGKARTS